MIDRGQPGKAIGESWLGPSNTLFHLWHQLRGHCAAAPGGLKPVREAVRLTLGDKVSVQQNAGMQELLGHEWL